MNVKVEKQENSKVVLEFTMDKEEFNKALDATFKKNAKYFKVQGFRNGKVPRSVVEKIYGENILYDEVINDIVDEKYQKAIEENSLKPVTEPKLDIKEIGKEKGLVYTITFCELPKATVSKYKELEINKFNTEVTEEDIQHELESIRDKNANIISIDNRALQDKDISTIDFEGFVDGVAFEGGKGENFELTIGSGQFIPGFEEQLIGMNIGEEKEINVKFPEDYHAADLANKEAMFKVKLISIKAKDLAEIDDEFAKDVSDFETLDEYKKDLSIKIKERKETQAKSDKEYQAIQKLLENTEVDIPEELISSRVESLANEYNHNLSHQGLSLEIYCKYINQTIEQFKENLKPQAVNDIKLETALNYIDSIEDIKIEDEEIDKRIEELFEGASEEKIASTKKNENARDYVRNQLKMDKTRNIVIDSVIEK